MVFRRPPRSLAEIAFASWLTALDTGVSLPHLAPPSLLSKALLEGSGLRESTVVHIAQAAAAAGVEQLNIKGEFLNPVLFQQLSTALTVQPTKLEKITLDLSPRLMHGLSTSLLASALEQMSSLKDVCLTGGATDELLKALATACPPLHNLDLSYSHGVTEEGLEALLYSSPGEFKLKKLNKSPYEEGSLINLTHLNIWDTGITTRGCMWILKYCQELKSLSCQWTTEALVFMALKQSNPLRLEQLLISEEEVMGSVLKAITDLCPCLKLLTIRRPKDALLNLNEISDALPFLEELSVLQFYPLHDTHLEVPYFPNLKELHLSPLNSPNIHLDTLLDRCSLLTNLTLDGVNPELQKRPPVKQNNVDTTLKFDGEMLDLEPSDKKGHFKLLKELRFMTTYMYSFEPLYPPLLVWILNNMTPHLSILDLGHCGQFQDEHLLTLLHNGSLNKVEDLRLSRATKLTDCLIHTLSRECPQLKRLVLRLLSKERLAQLETLKVDLRINNVDLELVTYGHKY